MSPLHIAPVIGFLLLAGCRMGGTTPTCDDGCEVAHLTPEARVKRFGSEALPKAYQSIRPHDLAGLAIFKTCREEQRKGTPPAGGVSCLDKHILECIRSCQDERME